MDSTSGAAASMAALMALATLGGAAEHAPQAGEGRAPGVPFSEQPGHYSAIRTNYGADGCTCGGSAKRQCKLVSHAQAKLERAASKRGRRRMKRLLGGAQ